MNCLICGSSYQVENAHWPSAVGLGRSRKKHPELPVIPLCSECHKSQHAGDEETVQQIIERAPRYWTETGQMELAYPYYARFLARREYIRSVG